MNFFFFLKKRKEKKIKGKRKGHLICQCLNPYKATAICFQETGEQD